MQFKEYPDIEIPQELLNLGFVDHSWHNDCGARMVHWTQENDEQEEKPVLHVFVGDKWSKREIGFKHSVGVWESCSFVESNIQWTGDSLKTLINKVRKAMTVYNIPAGPQL